MNQTNEEHCLPHTGFILVIVYLLYVFSWQIDVYSLPPLTPPAPTSIVTTRLWGLWEQEHVISCVPWSTHHSAWNKIDILTEFMLFSQVGFCTLCITKWATLLSSITGFEMHLTVFSLYFTRVIAKGTHCEWLSTYHQPIIKILKCLKIYSAVKYFSTAPWRTSQKLLYLPLVIVFCFCF